MLYYTIFKFGGSYWILSETEAEAQRATYLQAVRDNQLTAQQITRLFANPVMPM
jgi:hypothetical protein